MSSFNVDDGGHSAPGRYREPRAHALRERYLAVYGGHEIPVPVESIAEDLLGLRIELADNLDCSGVLYPLERRIVLNAAEATHDGEPIRRHRFTIAHELGHWICHALEGRSPAVQPTYCRSQDLAQDADRALEREANVFAAELLMPERAVRSAWDSVVAPASTMREQAVRDIAAVFGVSTSAAWYRLYGFQLVPTRPPAFDSSERGG